MSEMTMAERENLRQLLQPFRSARARSVLGLDNDGVLSPIVAEDARIPEETRGVLRALTVSGYSEVAVVTGRNALDARGMIGVPEILVMGLHGGELLRAGETVPILDPRLEPWTPRTQELMARLADLSELWARFDIRLENKGAFGALHWRGSRREDDADAVAKLAELVGQANGFETRHAMLTLEFIPAVEVNKNTAMRWLVRQTKARLGLFAGDGPTDVAGFQALDELKATGELDYILKIGVNPPGGEAPRQVRENADVMVEGTEQMLEVLKILAA